MMRHKWDYSRLAAVPRDMMTHGRRVCLTCGEEHKLFQKQWYMRVIGYKWSGDGRSPCPGKPAKRRKP